VGLLKDLQSLGLYGTKLTGTLPSEIAQMTSLEVLEVWNSRLTGTLPSVLFSMPTLKHLLLQNNDLSGTIPLEFTEPATTSLLTFNVSGNANVLIDNTGGTLENATHAVATCWVNPSFPDKEIVHACSVPTTDVYLPVYCACACSC